MQKEKIIIYDTEYLKKVSFEKLKDQKTCILFDTFKKLSIYDMDFNIKKEELQNLVIAGKLEITDIPTLYDNVPIRDKIIILSLQKSKDYDVVVYTDDCSLALDLLINSITVGTNNYSNTFYNIGKSSENGVYYFYDTCFIDKYIDQIDFSKNKHCFNTCVLEELTSFKNSFFKTIYALNNYPDNAMYVHTQKTDKRGGGYSYNDLLILYSTIAYQNNFLNNNNNIIFATCDRKLFFEAMYQNLFKVIDKPDYIDNYNYEHNKQVPDTNLSSINGRFDCNINNTSTDIVTIDTVNDDHVNKSNNMGRNIPDTRIRLPIKKISHHKILDEPDIVEKVLTGNKKYTPPISSKKFLEDCSNNAYFIFLGFYVVLKSEPDVLYKIVSLSKNEMFIEKEDIIPENDTDISNIKEDIHEIDKLSDLKEEIIAKTDNYTRIYLEKYRKKYFLDIPNIIEQVYTSKFAIVAPYKNTKTMKKFIGITYQIHPGYYITFKDDPKIYYKVMKVLKNVATIQKL